MPAEAARIICESLEWCTLKTLVGQIQEKFPQVSAKQVHKAWVVMSEEIWKQAKEQLPSARELLLSFPDDVDMFEVEMDAGVQQLCWGMKKIATGLKGLVVEIALDATCESKNKLVHHTYGEGS